jgi:hypothetical protein
MVFLKAPAFLETAFNPGFAQKDADGDLLQFSMVDIGRLNIKEGRIYACDPISLYLEEPFDIEFPKGQFPVQLAIAAINNDDERIGLARIKFTDTKPIKWTYALTEGQDVKDLQDDEIFGYDVDSGTGAFMDASGYVEYDSLYKEDLNLSTISREMRKTYKDTRSWLMWEGKNSNVAIFSSGYGEGLYATYIGFDDYGNICRLVTDFGLLDWQ